MKNRIKKRRPTTPRSPKPTKAQVEFSKSPFAQSFAKLGLNLTLVEKKK